MTTRRPSAAPWVVVAGAGTAAIGCFLPWVTATLPLVGQVDVNGLDGFGDGWLILVAAVVALGMGLVLRRRPDDMAAASSSALAGLGALAISAISFVAVLRRKAAVLEAADGFDVPVHVGSGIVLCLAGSLAVLVGGAVAVARARQSSEAGS